MDLTPSEPETEDMSASAASSFDIQVSITYPGEVIDADGEISGDTVTWTPRYGEVNEFNATAYADPAGPAPSETPTEEASSSTEATAEAAPADSTGSGFPWWIVWVGVGVLVLAGTTVTIILIVRKKWAANDPFGTQPYQQQCPGPYPQQPGQQGQSWQ